MSRRALVAAAVAAAGWGAPVAAQPASYITVASTTSTEQSGLFEHLLPAFTRDSTIDVRVVAVGTGQALKIGERGDCDVVLVHDTPAELEFVSRGLGIERREVMYNDFILVGPARDPAGIAGGRDSIAALRRIAEAGSVFVSRGDDSGTHKAELRLWQEAGIDPRKTGGAWYKDTGSGMGPTLNTTAGMDGYTLSDRGTWLAFKNRQSLRIVVEGDRRLFNQYGVMLVNPERHPHVKAALGRNFIDWLTSPRGQQAIADYKIGGEELFFPNYRKPQG